MRCSRLAAALVASLWMGGVSADADAENWPRFRGDNGSGVSSETGFPATWSAGDYAWNIELPGEGHSGPVIWGTKVFITSATEQGAIRYLFCLNADDGTVIWERTVGMNRSPKHEKSSWASGSPCTDGERVYVTFADKESYLLDCYTVAGELLWRRNFGAFESQHGVGVSPILVDDLVIIQNDQDGPSSMIAVDKRTGKTRWSTLRSIERTSYSTPIVITPKGQSKPQLICVSGASGVAGLDPSTGETLWRTDPFPLRTVASPIYVDGLIIASCGQGGRFGTLMRAVDPTGSGDVSKTHVKYERTRELAYVPTPVALGKHVYLWQDNGVVSCIEAATGKDVWKQRVGGNYSSSPILVDGKIYGVSEQGDVNVIAASPDYEFLGKTSLGDNSHATPAVANGKLYFRTFRRIMALEAAR